MVPYFGEVQKLRAAAALLTHEVALRNGPDRDETADMMPTYRAMKSLPGRQGRMQTILRVSNAFSRNFRAALQVVLG